MVEEEEEQSENSISHMNSGQSELRLRLANCLKLLPNIQYTPESCQIQIERKKTNDTSSETLYQIKIKSKTDL